MNFTSKKLRNSDNICDIFVLIKFHLCILRYYTSVKTIIYGSTTKELLYEQNPHWSGNQKSSIRREKLNQLIRYLPLRQIITITGIRRCGKSTLARQAIDHLIQEGTHPANILFVNLEQPLFLEYRHDPNYLNTIYEAYLKLMNPMGKTTVILDEIQFFDNWQLFVKSRYESSDIKFIITGSNSSLMDSEMNTLLSGRSLNIHLGSFTFREFLTYKQIGFGNELERIHNRIAIARAKEEYLNWGGFYEVFEIQEERVKKELLISYAKNIIYQDMIPRYGIRNHESIERLFFYLLSHVGESLNFTSLATTFGISDKSIREYVGCFEDVFLLSRCDRWHEKPKERIKSTKKLYVQDNGFLQIAPRHSKNSGIALENLVYLALVDRGSPVHYLKERHEIDFYTHNTLYQVSYDIGDDKTRKRELGAYGQFQHIPSEKKEAHYLGE